MSPWVLIGILIVIAVLLGTAGMFYMQHDFRKKAKGCVCVTFIGPLKSVDELWPVVDEAMVIPPEKHLLTGETFLHRLLVKGRRKRNHSPRYSPRKLA